MLEGLYSPCLSDAAAADFYRCCCCCGGGGGDSSCSCCCCSCLVLGGGSGGIHTASLYFVQMSNSKLFDTALSSNFVRSSSMVIYTSCLPA